MKQVGEGFFYLSFLSFGDFIQLENSRGDQNSTDADKKICSYHKLMVKMCLSTKGVNLNIVSEDTLLAKVESQ